MRDRNASILLMVFFFGVTNLVAQEQQHQPSLNKQLDKDHLPKNILDVQLRHDSAGVRANAATQLGRLGKSASGSVKSLVHALEDVNPEVRMNAAAALGFIAESPERCIPALIAQLDDVNEHVRYSAEWALARFALLQVKLSEAKERQQLFQLAEQKLAKRNHHQRHRLVIQEALANLDALLSATASAESAVPNRAPQFDEKGQVPPALPPQHDFELQRAKLANREKQFIASDQVGRLRIIHELAEDFAPELESTAAMSRVNVLRRILQQGDSEELNYCFARWTQHKHKALRTILASLPNDRAFPSWCIDLLDEYQPTELWEVNRLLRGLVDSGNSLEARIACAVSLGRTNSYTNDVSSALLAASLDSENPVALRMVMIRSIGNLNHGRVSPPELESQIQDLLGRPDEVWSIREAAASCLMKINPLSELVEETFVNAALAEDLNDYELASVVHTIAGCTCHVSGSVQFLVRGLRSEDEGTKLAALGAVQGLGGISETLIPVLLEEYQLEESSLVRSAIVRALAGLGDDALSKFGALVEQGNEDFRLHGLHALAGLGPRAVPALASCKSILADEAQHMPVRAAVLILLAKVGPDAANFSDLVLPLLEEKHQPAVRSLALLTLACLRTDAPMPEPAITDQDRELAIAHLFSRYLSGELQAVTELVLAEGWHESQLARQAVMDIGPAALGALRDCLDDESKPVEQREQAAVMLSKIPHKDYQRLIAQIDGSRLGQVCQNCLASCATLDGGVQLLSTLLEEHERSEAESRAMLQELIENHQVRFVSVGANQALVPENLLRGYEQMVLDIPAPTAEPGEELIAEETAEVAVDEEFAVPSMQELALGSVQEVSQDLGGADSLQPEFEGEAPNASPLELDPPTLSLQLSGEPAEFENSRVQPKALTVMDKISSKGENQLVNVFYATNRMLKDRSGRSDSLKPWQKIGFALTVSISMAFLLAGFWKRQIVLCSFFSAGSAAISILLLMSHHTDIGHPLAGPEFGSELTMQSTLGVCEVSIPRLHRRGEIERPSIFKLEFEESEERHVVLQSTKLLDQDEFNQAIQSEMSAKGKSLLVFVHGYNVSFEEAAHRTAQMSFDLSFPGAAAFFSWPSQDNWYQYQADRKNIELSIEPLNGFLTQLVKESKAESIHLVAHSMGNVALTGALAKMSESPSEPPFSQVILAAPDLDADVFRHVIAPGILGMANQYTLYTSKNDLALVASRYFNAGQRIGESLPGLQVPGIDVIDASDVDTSLLGHSYYGRSSVLQDMQELFQSPPLEPRTFVRTASIDGAQYHYLEGKSLAGAGPSESIVR
ncbi:MAG: alpha/beta hydrolase [Planctomycetota bacterium]